MLKKVKPYTLNHDKHGMLFLPCIETSNHGLTQAPNQAIKSHFSRFIYSTPTHYLSVRYGLGTLMTNKIMMEVLKEDKKRESLTPMRLIIWQWRGLTIDIDARSRDCHAMDALEL